MTATNTFSLFKSLASSRGWSVDTDDEALFVQSGSACLRLRHIIPDDVVILEITHGPNGDGFWLDLYSERTADAGVSLREMPTLADAIEYGLDLMGPGPLSIEPGVTS
jgi:hypothetical protein